MSLNNSQIFADLQDQNHLPSTGLLRLGGAGGGNQLDHFNVPAGANPSSFLQSEPCPASGFFLGSSSHDQFENKASLQGLLRLPDLPNCSAAVPPASAAANIFNLSFFSGNSNGNGNGNSNSDATNNQSTNLLFPNQLFNSGGGGGGGGSEQNALFSAAGNLQLIGGSSNSSLSSSIYNPPMPNDSSYLPQMSATALLQKAAQMGATTTSSSSPSLIRGFGCFSSADGAKKKPTNVRDPFGGGGSGEAVRAPLMENEYCNFQDLMNSLTSGGEALLGGNAAGHEQDAAAVGFSGFNLSSLMKDDDGKLHQNLTSGRMRASDRSTRDFLGVGAGMARNMGRTMSSQKREQQQQNRGGGVDHIDSLDSEMMRSAIAGGSFASGGLQ